MGLKGVNFNRTEEGFMGGVGTGIVGKSKVTITEMESYNSTEDFIEKKTNVFSRYDYTKDEVQFNGQKVNSHEELIEKINQI